MLSAIAIVQRAETYDLRSYVFECAWYWGPTSVVHLGLFLVGFFGIAAVSFYRRGYFWQWTRRWAIFNVCLFITAGLANGLWSCLVFGRLYWSSDYVFDLTPFWPVTQRTIDAPFGDQVGGLFGISLLHLQALWMLFAICTWVAAFALYRVCRNLGVGPPATNASNQAMQ
jgi:hypothetical protein